MDRLNNSYYSLAELPSVLNQCFETDITLQELIKCAEDGSLVTSFKAKGNNEYLDILCCDEKIEIPKGQSVVLYEPECLKKGEMYYYNLVDDYRIINLKFTEDKLEKLPKSGSKPQLKKYNHFGFHEIEITFSDFFVIPRLSYANNSFHKSSLNLSLSDFKYESIHSSEDKQIRLIFWAILDEKFISLPYTDIYVTRSHLVNFCQLYEKIASKINKMEQRQDQEELLIKIEEQEKEIQSLKNQIKNMSTETNKMISNNGIEDLTRFFSKERKEYPNHFLETALTIYNEVWVDYFSNRKDDATPRPIQERLWDKIKEMLPNSGWSTTEIKMLERIACPIIREGGKIKGKTKKTQHKGQKTIS